MCLWKPAPLGTLPWKGKHKMCLRLLFFLTFTCWSAFSAIEESVQHTELVDIQPGVYWRLLQVLRILLLPLALMVHFRFGIRFTSNAWRTTPNVMPRSRDTNFLSNRVNLICNLDVWKNLCCVWCDSEQWCVKNTFWYSDRYIHIQIVIHNFKCVVLLPNFECLYQCTVPARPQHILLVNQSQSTQERWETCPFA